MDEAPRKALGWVTAVNRARYVRGPDSRGVGPLGRLPFFIEFLKVSGLFDAWMEDCPLTYHSNHASNKCAVLATVLLSILAGHHHDAQITAIRHDGIHLYSP